MEITGLGAYQCSGVGRILLESIEHFARAKGHSAIILLAVPSAIQFYGKCGYSFLAETHTPVERALVYLSCKAAFRHAAMLKYM